MTPEACSDRSTEKHDSPRPWRVSHEGWIEDANGCFVADCRDNWNNGGNDTLTVTCVNAHDDLLAACKEVAARLRVRLERLAILGYYKDNETAHDFDRRYYEILTAAILKAEPTND